MTDEERLSAINETINKLRDEKTGLSSLKNLITDALKTEPTLIAAANQHILDTTEKKEYEPREHLDAFIAVAKHGFPVSDRDYPIQFHFPTPYRHMPT